MQLSVAFSLVADLAGVLGVKNINRLPKPWEYKLNDQWYIAVNATNKAHCVEPLGAMKVEVKPLHMAVWFNGWLAGLFTPAGGVFLAGSKGNEDAFIKALEANIQQGKLEREIEENEFDANPANIEPMERCGDS